MSTSEVRGSLQAALRAAMKERDRRRVATCRTALSALDNATAVPRATSAGAVEQMPVGVGSAEVERRTLDDGEARSILLREAMELAEAARHHPADTADELRLEADFLRSLAS